MAVEELCSFEGAEQADVEGSASVVGISEILGRNSGIYVDLEYAGTKVPPTPGMRPQIIEVGVVEMDLKSLAIIKEAAFVVRPKQWHTGAYRGRVAGPTDVEIGTAQRMISVLRRIEIEFDPRGKLFYAWGSDLEQLLMYTQPGELQRGLRRGTNLSLSFQEVYGIPQQLSLVGALSFVGRPFDGKPHRALVDARNTAYFHAEIRRKLCPKLYKDSQGSAKTGRPSLLESLERSRKRAVLRFADRLLACSRRLQQYGEMRSCSERTER